MTIWTQPTEIVSTIVMFIAVDMIDFNDKWFTHPFPKTTPQTFVFLLFSNYLFLYPYFQFRPWNGVANY